LKGATDISDLQFDDAKKRALELSAYTTVPELEDVHKFPILAAASIFAAKNEQGYTALQFADRVIDEVDGTDDPKSRAQAKEAEEIAEENPRDAIDIDFSHGSEFEICAASLTPILSKDPSVTCGFDGSKYHSKFEGSVCKICDICKVGAPASGLVLVGKDDGYLG
jgi:coatomer subunit alpha